MKLLSVSAVSIVTALVVAAPSGAPAQEGPVFHATNAHAEVWVSTDLAEHRTDMDYVPLLVAIKNQGPGTTTLTRDSFHLAGARGQDLEMPALRTLRDRYPKLDFDYTMGRVYGFTGIPVGTRLPEHTSIPSSFFPVVRSGDAAFDSVELPKNFWTVDMLYFPMPQGFAEGRPTTLVIDSDGWEESIEVDLHL